MVSKPIYVIGSMRNPRIPEVAKTLREAGYDVFDDWYSPGAQADEKWQEYEKDRGRSYQEALNGHHAKHVFALDRQHLERCEAVVLVMPAGKSAHMELGWAVGQGKPAFVLFDEEPERYDIMYRFVYETGGDVCFSEQELLSALGPQKRRYRRRAREAASTLRGRVFAASEFDKLPLDVVGLADPSLPHWWLTPDLFGDYYEEVK